MRNTKTIILVLISTIIIGSGAYIIYHKNKSVSNVAVTPTINTSVVYKNNEYGFTFSLPDSWRGYTIVQNTWQGYPVNDPKSNETGPKILIRNPNWTSAVHYEDIPILIFTTAQWDSYVAEDFAVSAAPIPASKLASNNKYVFALPPRWDYDFSKGYEEAENIIKSKPIIGFDIDKLSVTK
ncbi:MAG: hypothetical protein KGI58_01440 [Patescibacteria group bacterium]|nr:hypothetical protein [Patescibacteria group bacterium]